MSFEELTFGMFRVFERQLRLCLSEILLRTHYQKCETNADHCLDTYSL